MAPGSERRGKPISGRWKVQLSLSCLDVDLSAVDKPFFVAVLYLFTEEWVSAAISERVPASQNPTFEQLFPIFYRFEDPCPLRLVLFQVSDDEEYEVVPPKAINKSIEAKQGITFQRPRPLVPTDDLFFAEALCTIHDLITSRNNQGQFSLMSYEGSELGTLLIRLTDVSGDSLELSLQFRAKHLPSARTFATQDSVLHISRLVPSTGLWKKIVSTSCINSIHPIWELITCSISELCDGDVMANSIAISVDVGGHEIGKLITSVYQLLQEDKMTFLPGQSVVYLLYYRQKVLPSFLDYIASGWEFPMIIDYTASNGNPSNPSSLHYLSDTPNDYELALKNIYCILSAYSSEYAIPAFGYGGLLPSTQTVSHCFPLNHNPEAPEVHGIDGLIDSYRESLRTVFLKGPTVFSQLIRKAMELASPIEDTEDDSDLSILEKWKKYTILTIVTDGVIFDWRDTIDALHASAAFPLSILVIGIGTTDFEKMKLLHENISSSLGHAAMRRNVQFIALNDAKGNDGVVDFAEFLRSVPQQIVDFCRMNSVQAEILHDMKNELKHAAPDSFIRTTPPEWEKDEKAKGCELCNCTFSFITRRHHCRGCGKIICSACSAYNISIPQYNLQTVQRVCDTCYALLLRSRSG